MRTLPVAPGALLVRVIPVAALVAAAWAQAWSQHGSIGREDWLGYSTLAALALAAVLASGVAARPSGTALAAIVALLGLAAWAGISAAWSPAPSLARDEALLTATYAVAALLPLLTLRSEPDRLAALGVVVAGMATLALATSLALRLGNHTLDRYDDGRLDSPITYANAQAAMFLLAFWPAVVLAARRTLPALLRALAAGASVALLAGWLLTQSKGGGVALGLSAILVFALCPGRLRLAVPALLAAAVTGAAFAPLTGPFRTSGPVAEAAAIRHAGTTVIVVTAVGFFLGSAYVLADRLWEVPDPVRNIAGRAAAAGVALAVVGAVAGFFIGVDHPGSFLADRWRSFKHLPAKESAKTHLLTLGSNRYDFWRVGLAEFERRPLIGIGSRGFGPLYLEKGRSDETPARAHSLPIEMLAEDGLVGFALLLGALGIPLAVAARRARLGIASAVAALGAGAYLTTHSLVDWIWTFPAVGIPAFLLLGVGLARDQTATLGERLRLLALVPAAVATLAFAPPWLSEKLTTRAETGQGSPSTELRWARRLDPLSTDVLVSRAVLAATPRESIPPLEQAVSMEPHSVALQYFLGVTYLEAGRYPAARRALRLAHALAPRDKFVSRALQRALKA